MYKFRNGWMPANSSCTTTGDMICCNCKLPIGKDQYYQYRQKPSNSGNDWAYQCQHKECATAFADAWDDYMKARDEEQACAKHISDIAREASPNCTDTMWEIEGAIYALIDAGYSVVKTNSLIDESDYIKLKAALIESKNFWNRRLNELGSLSSDAALVKSVVEDALKHSK